MSASNWAAVVAVLIAGGMLAMILVRMARSDTTATGARNCPPGQVWLDGHCHTPGQSDR